MATASTGYGPSKFKLNFDGEADNYDRWEVKFLGYMRIKELKETILPRGNGEENPEDFDSKNELAFAELIQFLDDRSLSLVMRDAVDDGRAALKILRQHYQGKGKPRVITLYTDLTSLKFDESRETLTDYVIRAEDYVSKLRSAGERVTDSLLVAMVMKGLPPKYEQFVFGITQRERQVDDFTQFKIYLRNFEEQLKSMSHSNLDSVLKVSKQNYQ